MTSVRQGTAASAVLTAEECAGRLASIDLGRVAWVHDGAPQLRPVTFAMHDGSVVFRTRPGSPMAVQLPGSRVAFEVDSADFANLVGWSVVVTGICRPAPEELAGRMTPWADGDRSVVLRIDPDATTGRRLDQVR
jgi:nitroimidazol reductase NimA-like FMN-containing flavoprotein (pyridoxamine 5'-phosphate oxidase superfamily)